MKLNTVFLALVFSAAAAAVAQEQAPARLAIIRHDILLKARSTDPLPAVMNGQVLPCQHVAGEGFHVVCRDAQGRRRIALLPPRDEWGHATAAAWTHDDTLEDHTIRVKIALPLKPGTIFLASGRKLPVVAQDDDCYTLGLSFGGYSRAVRVARQDVQIEVPPVKSPEEIRLEQMESRWDRASGERDALQERLTDLEDANQRMHELVLELRDAETETGALRIRIDAAVRKQAMLVDHKPTDSDAVKEEQARLLAAVRQKEDTEINGARSELLVGDLKTLHRQLERAEQKLQDAKVHVARTGTQLGVLEKAVQDDGTREERAALEAEVVGKEGMVAAKETTLLVESGKRDQLAELAARIAALEERNTELAEALRAVAEELERLRAGGVPAQDK